MILRIAILASVAAACLALVVAPTAGAQSGDAIPGGIYVGTSTEGCQGDAIQAGPEMEFRLNDHGTEIVSFTVNDLVTPLGSFESLMIPISVRINDDGSFEDEFDPLNVGLALVRVEGQFEGDAVSGSFTVEVDGAEECAGTFTMEGSPPPARPPSVFLGSVDAVANDCGGGDIDITVSGNRLSVIGIAVRNLSVHGTPVTASATFAEGTVPIAEDGSFDWAYFPGVEASQEIAVIGTVSFAFMSGAITVSPSQCGAIPFEGVSPQTLARGGTGPGASSSGTSFWLAVVGAAGLALVAVGAVLRRRLASR